jgi:hypothetical protein
MPVRTPKRAQETSLNVSWAIGIFCFSSYFLFVTNILVLTTNYNTDSEDYQDQQPHYEGMGSTDPTHVVDGYLKAWWLNVGDEVDFPSYAFDPQEYLEVHWPQVSNMFLAFYLLL